MTSPRPLQAVPDPDASDEDGPGEADTVAAEHAAAAEVTRARAELPTCDPDAFDCYLGGLVQAVAATTEADPIAVLASLLAAAGVRIGQGPHVRAGDDAHPLLLWPLIVGKTSAGRKGASWSTARRLLTAADPDFTTTNIKSGLTSGEGLANMFTTPDTPETTNPADTDTDTPAGVLPAGDRRLLVIEPEWAGVMAKMRRDGNSLAAILRAAWEGGDLSTLAVTARIAPSSHVGILAHITPEEFRAKVSTSDMAGGTYNRFLPLAVARSQFLPLSAGAAPELIDQLGASLAARLTQAAQLEQLHFTGPGAATWRRIYIELGSTTHTHDPAIVEQFTSRAAPNCLRLAGLHAALDRRDAIEPRHLTAAAALIRYSLATARHVFTHNPTLARLATWITEAGPTGRTREQIRSDYFRRNAKAADITTYLDQLEHDGHITRHHRPREDGKPGRPTELFTAATAPARE